MNKLTARKTVLIIDDDRVACAAIADYLTRESVEAIAVHTGEEGIDFCSRRKVDVVLLDQNLPDAEGHSLCPKILKCNEYAKIIFITAYPSFDKAVKAIKAGAHDYLSKPFELDELSMAIEQSFRTIELENVEAVNRYKEVKESEDVVLVGADNGLRDVKSLVDLAATVDAPVLITGETGTGKSVAAKYIHYSSPMKKGAFISINCAALPESLIESELFGYEKGAFTGAFTARKGIFEMAENGMLLLDEIGEMTVSLQAKLLGVLEDRIIKRLGGESIRPVNTRVVATTNVDLEDAVKNGRFRKDLYYRLNVIRIHIPPLRERRGDIPGLCEHLLKKSSFGRGARLPDEELAVLMNYDWPGNVRELQNILDRSVMLSRGGEIRPSALIKTQTPQAVRECPPKEPHEDAACPAGIETLKEVEKAHIAYVVSRLSNNYSHTARVLGISRTTLLRKLKEYHII